MTRRSGQPYPRGWARGSDLEGGSRFLRPALPVGSRRARREEKAEEKRARLFDAAISVVGEFGYAGTTVSRITERAGVSQGSFYSYFKSRQDLLDQLLPAISRRLLDHVRDRVRTAPDDPLARERARITAFFEFQARTPDLYKILHEGEIEAREGFRRHVVLQSESYERALRSEAQLGHLRVTTAEAIAAITQILMGARAYLSLCYCIRDGEVVQPPDHVVETYMAMMTGGLFVAPK